MVAQGAAPGVHACYSIAPRVLRYGVGGEQPAPLDVLRADEALAPEAVEAAHSAMSMWTLEHSYPMLPYSAVVLESVPDSEVLPAHIPLSRKLDAPRDPHKANGVGPSTPARWVAHAPCCPSAPLWPSKPLLQCQFEGRAAYAVSCRGQGARYAEASQV